MYGLCIGTRLAGILKVFSRNYGSEINIKLNN
jgi:hypothetical protein